MQTSTRFWSNWWHCHSTPGMQGKVKAAVANVALHPPCTSKPRGHRLMSPQQPTHLGMAARMRPWTRPRQSNPPPPFNPGGFSPDGTLAPPGGRFQPGYANPPPPTAGGQHMYGCAPHGGIPPQGATQAAPYSNVVKRFVNWNTCVCVDLLTSGESLYHDWVSTQRPAFSHYLEAALSRI
jgi:hypothetical protein